MALFILVHGGSQTGKIWEAVGDILKKDGHLIYAPTLSNAEISSLRQHIDEVSAFLEKSNEAILVGHSYGGMVITGVANQLPQKVKHLYYIDAAVPESGQSLFEVIDSTGYSALSYYHLDPFKPFTEALYFDSAILKKIPKTYVLCTKSEFIGVTQAMKNKLAEQTDWKCLALDTTHSPMISMPHQLAKILSAYV